MITLVGVGHVFDLRDAIDHILEDRRPDVVALEMDRYRFAALRQEQQGKGKGLYGALAKYQQQLAKEYGTTPGAEMLVAASKARSLGAQVALIDMDARLAFQKLWKSMRFREKLYLFFGSIGGLFVRKKRMKKEIDRLQKEPEVFMDELGKRLPTAKTVLVDDRNSYMATNIKKLGDRYERIVVFVGDGHIKGLDVLLEGEKEIIRLNQHIEGGIPPSPYPAQVTGGNSTPEIAKGGASFSFSVTQDGQ
ncbi:MAG: TraB/GumN family protein [Thermoplasmata archaeon]|nr:TraB/GumN family protein [Thermoplasmata archaeon]